RGHYSPDATADLFRGVCRGLIEARKRAQTVYEAETALFRGVCRGLIEARHSSVLDRTSRVAYSAAFAAASLKRRGHRALPVVALPYSAAFAAASLKHERKLAQVTDYIRLFRGVCRGLIEATTS